MAANFFAKSVKSKKLKVSGGQGSSGSAVRIVSKFLCYEKITYEAKLHELVQSQQFSKQRHLMDSVEFLAMKRTMRSVLRSTLG